MEKCNIGLMWRIKCQITTLAAHRFNASDPSRQAHLQLPLDRRSFFEYIVTTRKSDAAQDLP